MITSRQIVLVAIALLILGLACAKETSDADLATIDRLAKSYDAVGIDRSSSPRLFVGQDLYEYINGGAELYHQYKFVEVATADYKKGETEMVVDLYKFDSPTNAYGLYSMLRPDDADLFMMGMEGFLAPSKIEFVKGDLLVRIIGYDDSDETALAMVNLAEEVNKQLPGDKHLPATFGQFPNDNIIIGTAKYFAEAYLGQSFLTSVYCRNFAVGADTVTLFLCDMDGGVKLLDWSRRAEEAGKLVDAPAGVAFADGKAIGVNDGYYGQIVAGMSGHRMVGLVGFSTEHQEFFNKWLESLE